MRRLSSWALLASALSIAGCAAVTPEDLARQSDHVLEFSAPAPAPATYRRLVTGLRECWFSANVRVDADYFSDLQSGRISVGSSVASITFLTIKIDAVGPDASAVKAHYSSAGSAKQWRESLIPWAQGQPGHCMAREIRGATPLFTPN